jgi:DNA primase
MRVIEYLKSRYVPPARATSYGIGFCVTGYYAGRIIIPVEYHKQLYTFVARALDPAVEPKVLYPAGSRRSDVVFNLDRLERLQHPRPLIITEGVFDALRLPNQAVAILGSQMSAQQVTLLGRLPVGWRPFIIMMDGDKAGRNASLQIHRALWSHGIPHVEARLPDGMDPSDAPSQFLDAAIKDALDNFAG